MIPLPFTEAGRLAALATLSVALAVSPAFAQSEAETGPPPPEHALFGLWYADRAETIRLGHGLHEREVDGVSVRTDLTVCPEFTFISRQMSGQAILDDWAQRSPVDPGGHPLDAILAPAIVAAETYPMIAITCLGRGEIGVALEYIALDDDRVLEIISGDGVVDLDLLARTVPEPGHDWLSQAEREEIQRALQDLDLYPGAIDGVFGQGTVAAITGFQNRIQAAPTGLLSGDQIRVLFRESRR